MNDPNKSILTEEISIREQLTGDPAIFKGAPDKGYAGGPGGVAAQREDGPKEIPGR